jgi:acyl-CoA synthetase (AMP-forming)/AMP-acid ligase II
VPSGGTLLDLIEPTNRIALTKDMRHWTYEAIRIGAERVAVGLVAAGVGPGDRVVLHLGNGPEILISYLACFRIGAIAAPMNLRYKTLELEAQLMRLRPAAYVGDTAHYRLVKDLPHATLDRAMRFVVGEVQDDVAQPWEALKDHGGAVGLAAPDPDGVAVLLSTSGTTGRSKFVAHSQATLLRATEFWRLHGMEAGDVLALFLPMVHVSGLFSSMLCLFNDIAMALSDPANPDGVLDSVQMARCTHLFTFPAVAVSLIQRQRARPRDVSSLRSCIAAGDVCPDAVQRDFPVTFGLPLHTAWASTEGLGCLLSAGRPGRNRTAPGVEVKLVDTRGNPVPAGAPGEALMQGPNVALGYWEGPSQLRRFPDGWYPTGDMMRQEQDGSYSFVSRLKDLIIRGGSNISPVEVEQVLLTHPDVAEAGVVGVPDAVLGQRVAALLRLRAGVPDSRLADIVPEIAYALADYKLPEIVKAVESLPRNALGKVERHLLLDLATRPD